MPESSCQVEIPQQQTDQETEGDSVKQVSESAAVDESVTGNSETKIKEDMAKIRKSDIARQNKIRKLRTINVEEISDVDYDSKINDIHTRIEVMRVKLKKIKMSIKASDVNLIILLDNDILGQHVRALSFNIEDMENKLDLVKKAHRRVVDDLSRAHKINAEQYELDKLKIQIKNTKSDLYEATCLIHELQKVAYAMLPNKIAQYCEYTEKRMDKLKTRLDELLFKNYKMKFTNNASIRHMAALTAAIEGERTLKELYESKIEKATVKNAENQRRLTRLTHVVVLGKRKLARKGFTLAEALDRAKQMDLDHSLYPEQDLLSKLDPIKRRRSVVMDVEKIQFLQEKTVELDHDIDIAKKEYDKVISDNANMQDDIKKVSSIKQELARMRDMKEIMSIRLHQEVIMRKTYYNEIEDLKGKIRVYCRCRPISKSELDRGSKQCVQFPDIYTCTVAGVSKERKPKEFQFDRVFSMDSSQSEVFADTSKLIQSSFDGFNVCIFAYGQTGSGKTHTLIGNLDNNPGIAPRSFERIFEIVNDSKVKFASELKCYMLELYNEKLLDLMTNGAEYSDKLEIKKDSHGMVIVPGAQLVPAKSSNELRELFLRGNSNRHIASTKMNSESSRSHLIISIMITCHMVANNKVVRGKLSIIDLAGSERMAKSGVKGVGAQEAMSINMSLSALGDVISALTSGQPFVPYRNNKLTMLMQDSLGGNAKTLMFVNISPVDYNATETASSLTYAARVKLIKNDATKVQDSEEIVKLQIIIDQLIHGESVSW